MRQHNYNKLKSRIHGPVFSVVTPFLVNDDIDYISLERYLSYAYKQGARAFYVMGYNSRYSELSWDEIKQLNQFVTNHLKSMDPQNLVIVADPLHCSAKVSLEFAQHAEEIGADIISLICREKFYFEDQIYAHYKYIADGSPMPILIHEMPFLNGLGGPPVNWPVSLLARLSRLDQVVAIKEDAKDDQYSMDVINATKDNVAIVISGGGKRQWLRFSNSGCQAWLNGVGVFEPKLAINFYNYYKDGQSELIESFLNDIEIPFFEKGVKKFGWHLTIKAALEERGHMSRHERLPLLALPDDKANEVKQLIRSLPIEKYMK